VPVDVPSLIPLVFERFREHAEVVSDEIPHLLERPAEVPDRRDPGGVRHALVAVLAQTECVVPAGATTVPAAGEWIADRRPMATGRGPVADGKSLRGGAGVMDRPLTRRPPALADTRPA
jgi:hypothetical protein